jgi:hypothetical protein
LRHSIRLLSPTHHHPQARKCRRGCWATSTTVCASLLSLSLTLCAAAAAAAAIMVFFTGMTRSAMALQQLLWIMVALALLLQLPTTLCFAPQAATTTSSSLQQQPQYSRTRRDETTTTVRLFATTPTPPTGKRREVFGWLKKAAIAVAAGFGTASSSTLIGTTTTAASAATTTATATSTPTTSALLLTDEQLAAVTGRVVTLVVQNLDGDAAASQSGTVKIQLAPTWAPRGVARFEVSTTKRNLVVSVFCWHVSLRTTNHSPCSSFFVCRN